MSQKLHTLRKVNCRQSQTMGVPTSILQAPTGTIHRKHVHQPLELACSSSLLGQPDSQLKRIFHFCASRFFPRPAKCFQSQTNFFASQVRGSSYRRAEGRIGLLLPLVGPPPPHPLPRATWPGCFAQMAESCPQLASCTRGSSKPDS